MEMVFSEHFFAQRDDVSLCCWDSANYRMQLMRKRSSAHRLNGVKLRPTLTSNLIIDMSTSVSKRSPRSSLRPCSPASSVAPAAVRYSSPILAENVMMDRWSAGDWMGEEEGRRIEATVPGPYGCRVTVCVGIARSFGGRGGEACGGEG